MECFIVRRSVGGWKGYVMLEEDMGDEKGGVVFGCLKSKRGGDGFLRVSVTTSVFPFPHHIEKRLDKHYTIIHVFQFFFLLGCISPQFMQFKKGTHPIHPTAAHQNFCTLNKPNILSKYQKSHTSSTNQSQQQVTN